jgi:hypothetical protein
MHDKNRDVSFRGLGQQAFDPVFLFGRVDPRRSETLQAGPDNNGQAGKKIESAKLRPGKNVVKRTRRWPPRLQVSAWYPGWDSPIHGSRRKPYHFSTVLPSALQGAGGSSGEEENNGPLQEHSSGGER